MSIQSEDSVFPDLRSFRQLLWLYATLQHLYLCSYFNIHQSMTVNELLHLLWHKCDSCAHLSVSPFLQLFDYLLIVKSSVQTNIFVYLCPFKFSYIFVESKMIIAGNTPSHQRQHLYQVILKSAKPLCSYSLDIPNSYAHTNATPRK